ncbi:hypothetical protein DASB73_019390 [Starmerella bacillaris]|uniref:Uncharacterized protein n=1 Tax=Starmerella bacillaris TaxID=1247836 RepID=A0AAV5RK41_STABA|nr:hypothetical protein DASB73_019390 [Starmerella bacillaris]
MQSVFAKYGVVNGRQLAASIVENSHLEQIRNKVLKTQVCDQKQIAVSRQELLSAWPKVNSIQNHKPDIRKLYKLGAIQKLNGSESVFKVSPELLKQLALSLNLVSFPNLHPQKSIQSIIQTHLLFVRAEDCILRQIFASTTKEKLSSAYISEALKRRCLPDNGGQALLKSWVQNFQEPMDAGYFCINK